MKTNSGTENHSEDRVLTLQSFVRFLHPKNKVGYIRFQNRFAYCADNKSYPILESELSRALDGRSTQIQSVSEKIRLQISTFSMNLAKEIMSTFERGNTRQIAARLYIDVFFGNLNKDYDLPPNLLVAIQEAKDRLDREEEHTAVLADALMHILIYVCTPGKSNSENPMNGIEVPYPLDIPAEDYFPDDDPLLDIAGVNGNYRLNYRALMNDVISEVRGFYVQSSLRNEKVLISTDDKFVRRQIENKMVVSNPHRKNGLFLILRSPAITPEQRERFGRQFTKYEMTINGQGILDYLASLKTQTAIDLLEAWENSGRPDPSELLDMANPILPKPKVDPKEFFYAVPVSGEHDTIHLHIEYQIETELRLDALDYIFRLNYPCYKLHHEYELESPPGWGIVTFPFTTKQHNYDGSALSATAYYEAPAPKRTVRLNGWHAPGSLYLRKILYDKPVTVDWMRDGFFEDR